METKFRKALVLTLNFSQKDSPIISPPFSSGGCDWIVKVNPKGNTVDNYLSLFLSLNETKSFGLIWKVKARFYFVLLNQSREETDRTRESNDRLFCASDSFSWGWDKAFPLEKVLEKGVLVDDRFTIEIYIKVLEVIDGSKKENVDVNGFNVLSSQVTSVRQIFVDHPDIALDFKSKNQVVKREYMNILLNLLETVKKPLKSITETEISNAQSELCELTEVGFKVEWLKTKLEEVSLEWKKAKTNELDEEKAKSTNDAAKVLSLEKMVSDLKTELANEKAKLEEVKKVNAEGIQQSEEQVKNLELNLSSLKVELDKEKAKSSSLEKTLSNLKTELANEKTKSANFMSLKEAFSDLGVEMEKEKDKSTSAGAELANEKTKSARANTKFWMLNEKFSDLKAELDNEKAKSTSVPGKALSLKEIWSGLKVKKDRKKENSAITDNLLSSEDADLVLPTNCLGNGYKRIN